MPVAMSNSSSATAFASVAQELARVVALRNADMVATTPVDVN